MARDFVGSGNSWLASSSPAVTAVPYTLAVIGRPDVNNTQQVALGMFDATLNNPITSLRCTSGGLGDAVFRADNGSSSTATGTSTISTTAFQSLVGTFDASAIARFYYNGALEATGGTPTSTVISLDNVLVGVRLNNAVAQDRWNGVLCECAIWNRVLSNGEITALGKFYSPLWFRNGLVWYRDLIRDLNRPYIGPTMSITGTVDVAQHSSRIIYPFPRAFVCPPRPRRPLAPVATISAGDWMPGG